MSQKKRISDEAFPWVKDTSGEKKQVKKKQLSEKKTSSSSKKRSNSTLSTTSVLDIPQTKVKEIFESVSVQQYSEKKVFVQFNTKGDILIMARLEPKYLIEGNMPFKETDEYKVAELKIPLDFVEKSLSELHNQCKVEGVNSDPYLTIK